MVLYHHRIKSASEFFTHDSMIDRLSVRVAVVNLRVHTLSFEPCHEKTNNVVSEHVRHKLRRTSTEDGLEAGNFGLEK